MRICAGPTPVLNDLMECHGRLRMEASPDPQIVRKRLLSIPSLVKLCSWIEQHSLVDQAPTSIIVPITVKSLSKIVLLNSSAVPF